MEMSAVAKKTAASWAWVLVLSSCCIWLLLWLLHQQTKGRLAADIQAALDAGRLEQLSGTVTRAYQNRYGVWVITVNGHDTLLVMPNMGVLAEKPEPGHCLQAAGRKRRSLRYDQPAFYPVSASAIQLFPPSPHSGCGLPIVTIAQAARMEVGQWAWLEVRGASAQIFRSQAGRQHLRVWVRDETGEAHGIMWEGQFSDRDRELLQSGDPVRLLAQVDSFGGSLSLIVWKVEPSG